MSTPLFAAQPETSLLVVRKVMQDHQINRVVVTDEHGSLRGIVTQSSLLQVLNPAEIYQMMEILQHKVSALENEKMMILQEHNNVLKSQVQMRTQELEIRKEYEHKLERSNLELIRATRLKDEFLANMSHELRTPLNAILGMSEILQEEVHGSLNEQQQKSVMTIEKSGRHLLELINEILELSKIEAGKLELFCTKVAIDQLCHSSLAFIKQQSFQKKICLTTDIPTDLGEITVDERRLRQVLINLLSNAVKFTPNQGRITLSVYLDKSCSHLCIAVQDTGIGIAADDLPKLFKSFSQIDSQLNRQYEGTGLGLALAQKIIELHGGSITVQSEVGQGSCFTIQLPYCLPVVVPCLHPSEHLTPAELHTDQIVNSTRPVIVLAEDNEDNCNIVSGYLEAKGYRVLVAPDGQTAIDLTSRHHPDIILMDIQMPGMDGIEAMKYIRSQQKFNQIPIIALTALAMPGDREKFITAGATDYLSKPVRLRELLSTIEKILRQ